MGRACRDCPRCVESPIVSLVMIPVRIALWTVTFWNVRLFQKWCPQCGHRLAIHKRIGGRFVD